MVFQVIDLHTHSIFSDGELVPAELAQRAWAAGYKTIAITDHADHSNIDFVIPRIVKVCNLITEKGDIEIIPGIELTHVHPGDIASLADEARKIGAKIIVVHGETITEPVPAGTNLAAIKAEVDILAHPGLIGEEEVKLAAQKGVYLEKFDSLFHIDASIKADTAYYYEKKKLWELRSNVHIRSQRGDKFDTDLLFWDEKQERVYSDKFIRIEQEDKIITGYGFESNQQMTEYQIYNNTGIFTVEDTAPADSTKAVANSTRTDSIR